MHFLDLLNRNVVKILHNLLVSRGNLVLVHIFGGMLLLSALGLVLTRLSGLQSEFPSEVLLRGLVLLLAV